MGLMPRGTWEKLCLNHICAPPPPEKGGHNWKIIGDPLWTIRNMAVPHKKNYEHHNGKMGKIPLRDSSLRAKTIGVYREMCGLANQEFALSVNRDLEKDTWGGRLQGGMPFAIC